MKKLLQILALCLTLTLSTAFAADDVLFRHTAGDGWAAPGGLKEALEKADLLKNGHFPTSVLAKLAHDHLKEKNLPGGNTSFDKYVVEFAMANKLALGGSIAVTDFQSRAKAGEFKLPLVIDRVADFKTEEPASTMPTASTTASQMQPSGAMAISVTNLERELKELADAQDRKHQGIIGRLNAMQRQLQSNPSPAEVQKILEEGKVIASLSGRVLKLENDVNALTKRVGKVEWRTAMVERSINNSETGLNAVGAKATTAMNLAKNAEEAVGEVAWKLNAGLIANAVFGILSVVAFLFAFASWRRGGPAAVKSAAPDSKQTNLFDINANKAPIDKSSSPPMFAQPVQAVA